MSAIPVIVGSGVAGLTTALALAPAPVIILTRRFGFEGTSSALAQGGIAAALGVDDSPVLHAMDTMAAGNGLCNSAIVKLVTESAPQVVKQLIAWGVKFDRDEKGKIKLGLEAAHGLRRIVHAEGDGTGAAVMRALAKKVRATASIKIVENVVVTDLLVDDGVLLGLCYRDEVGKPSILMASDVLLATGGVGGLWRHTTNPLSSWGQGVALAARAGAALRDMAFVQFHPTAIDVGLDPMPLASEALRGEGAVLINDRREEVMWDIPRRDLASRDLVARMVWEQMKQGHRVYLDARRIDFFEERFPIIFASCAKAGFDPSQKPIPIRPAAHFHMGGVAVDADGRSTVKGLWACGEAASTGLHGANRLASNSLLEAVVFGQRAAAALRERFGEKRSGREPSFPPLKQRVETLEERQEIRALMSAHVGIAREASGLRKAVMCLGALEARSDMAYVGALIAKAALQRAKSCGAHYRTDDCSIVQQKTLKEA